VHDSMTHHPKRRAVLRAAVLGAAGALLPALGPGPAAAADGDLAAVALTGAVTQITGAGTNVLVLETDDGLVLVDSGEPEHADALLRFIGERCDGAPVRIVFSTHWHVANTGATERLGDAGARIVAHENTRLWMSTEYYVEWEKKNYLPRPRSAWPTETFR